MQLAICKLLKKLSLLWGDRKMKIPKIEKLPSGHYFCRLRINGVSIPITAESKTDCEKLAYLKKSEILSGKSYVKKTPKEITLQEAMDKYIKANKATLSPSTHRSYTIYARNRFPNYRKEKLSKIKWQDMIDEELELASEKTVKNAWALVTPSLRHVGYPVPKVRLSQVPEAEVNFLQPEEIAPFCKAVKGRSCEIPALLALNGLRVSEIRGLTWSNVNLESNMVFVRGAVVRGVDGDTEKETNKNTTSTRPVPILIPQLHDALDAVTDKTGHVVSLKQCSILDDVKRACKRANVTVCTTHDLRRSFASLCFFLQIPSKQIQAWGGWKNEVVLNKIYIKLAASMETENRKTVSSFFDNKKSTEENPPVQS